MVSLILFIIAGYFVATSAIQTVLLHGLCAGGKVNSVKGNVIPIQIAAVLTIIGVVLL